MARFVVRPFQETKDELLATLNQWVGDDDPDHGVILDGPAARRAAYRLHLTVYGTLSVLAAARKRGLIRSLRRGADAVARAELHIPAALAEGIATQLGE